MVITCALHAQGPQFDPGWRHFFSYLGFWEVSSLLWWWLFEQSDCLYDLESLLNVTGILLYLISQRLKLGNSLYKQLQSTFIDIQLNEGVIRCPYFRVST